MKRRLVSPDAITAEQKKELLRQWAAFPCFTLAPASEEVFASLLELGLVKEGGGLTDGGIVVAKQVADAAFRMMLDAVYELANALRELPETLTLAERQALAEAAEACVSHGP